MVGAAITLVAGGLFIVFLVIEQYIRDPNPYLGIFVYMALPPVLMLGILLIPIGMLRTKRIIRKRGDLPMPKWPAVDLNKRPHRNAFFVFSVGTVALILVGTVGGYQAFHFSESVEFCGTTCHEVMKPEHVAYQSSAHARVACTSCHVGPGAGWYARSKLSGAYQVYATARNIYPRPIPTPVKALRPAQETCEKCHWPEKFFSAQQKRFNHFMYDEQNTAWPINILLKTGGGGHETREPMGIHWHMNISRKIEYIARDERRQDIPWIRVTDRKTQVVAIFQNEEDPLTEEEIAAATPRVMDCMDCHNRPSHNYHSPDHLMDQSMASGRIDPSLPEVKRIAVEAMSEMYDTEEEALSAIATAVSRFYTDEYPEVAQTRQNAIEATILEIQQRYSTNMFPEMKVRWDQYPDNIGHFINPGCMRCHDGNHVSDQGAVVSRDCTSCHAILSQGSGDRTEWATSIAGLDFVHPEDIDEEWKESGCYECHEGTQP